MPQNGALLDRIFSELNALEPKRIKELPKRHSPVVSPRKLKYLSGQVLETNRCSAHWIRAISSTKKETNDSRGGI